jgi:hypothetical protein
MRRRALVLILVGMASRVCPVTAHETVLVVTAQLDCKSLAPGPAQTDCYIALSRIHRQEFDIAEGVAHRSKDIARYHKSTGHHSNAKARAAKQKW